MFREGSLAGQLHICIAGATGTIGRASVRECVARGHRVTALVRPGAVIDPVKLPELRGAEIHPVDVSDTQSVQQAFSSIAPDAVISCLASRSGAPADALAVDRDANVRLMEASKLASVSHFILLSAICLQRPKLAFQHAKLEAEAALKASGLGYTIIRPTAFFKSLSGQVQRVAKGKPFLIFGDGELTRCKPISDSDLARFMADCLSDPARRDAILPIGGPGPAISLKEQGQMLFEMAGREPKFRSVPPAFFDWVAKALSLGAPFSDWFAAKGEYARIGKYYATESMLVLDPQTGRYDADATPEYGTETLRDHYAALLAQQASDAHLPASAQAGG